MRWGDELLDENNKERTELKKQLTGYRWMSVRPHARPPVTHTDLGLAIKTLGCFSFVNGSALMMFTTSPRACKAEIPFGSSPALCTIIPKRWAPKHQTPRKVRDTVSSDRLPQLTLKLWLFRSRFWVSFSGGCAAWEPVLSHTLPHTAGPFQTPVCIISFQNMFLKQLLRQTSEQLLVRVARHLIPHRHTSSLS